MTADERFPASSALDVERELQAEADAMLAGLPPSEELDPVFTAFVLADLLGPLYWRVRSHRALHPIGRERNSREPSRAAASLRGSDHS